MIMMTIVKQFIIMITVTQVTLIIQTLELTIEYKR